MATIRKRGRRWQVQIRRKGYQAVSRTFVAKKDAATWARQMEASAEPKDARPIEGMTLGQLVTRYRDQVTAKKRGADQERIGLNAFLRHPICGRALTDITTGDFAAYRDERLKDVKLITVKRQLSPIHNMYELARNEWILRIGENPLDKLNLKTTGGRRERRLRKGEWEKIVAAAGERLNPLVLPILELALDTGMRRGEILNIRWGDYDAQSRSLLLRETKNGEPRLIPLSKKAAQIIEKRKEDDGGDVLFPISPNALRLSWERVRKKAGIEDLHFHDLRHEAVSRFFEAGLTTPEVASLSGHKDVRMLFRYAHPMQASIREKLGW